MPRLLYCGMGGGLVTFNRLVSLNGSHCTQLITCGAVELLGAAAAAGLQSGGKRALDATGTTGSSAAAVFLPLSLFQPALAGAGARSRTARRVQDTAPLGRERSKQAAVVWFTGRGTGLPTGGRALPAWAGDSAGWRLQPGVVRLTRTHKARDQGAITSRSLALWTCAYRAHNRASYLLHAVYGLRTPTTFLFFPPTLP